MGQMQLRQGMLLSLEGCIFWSMHDLHSSLSAFYSYHRPWCSFCPWVPPLQVSLMFTSFLTHFSHGTNICLHKSSYVPTCLHMLHVVFNGIQKFLPLERATLTMATVEVHCQCLFFLKRSSSVASRVVTCKPSYLPPPPRDKLSCCPWPFFTTIRRLNLFPQERMKLAQRA